MKVRKLKKNSKIGAEISALEDEIISQDVSDEKKVLLFRERLDAFYNPSKCKEKYSDLLQRLIEIDSRDNYIRNIALPSLLGAGIGTAASTVFGLNLFAQKANSVVPVLIQIIGIIVFALFVAFVTVMPFPEYNRPSISEILFSKEYEKKLINQILQVRLEEEATKHRNTRDGTVCSDKALK